MNEFTKEELICLRDNIVVPETTPEKRIILDAYRKIVMIIDNYCEHYCKDTIVYSGVTTCSKCDYPVGPYRDNK